MNLEILTRMLPVHNAGIKCSIGAFRSSPIAGILAITGEPPLQYRGMKLSLKYI